MLVLLTQNQSGHSLGRGIQCAFRSLLGSADIGVLGAVTDEFRGNGDSEPRSTDAVTCVNGRFRKPHKNVVKLKSVLLRVCRTHFLERILNSHESL